MEIEEVDEEKSIFLREFKSQRKCSLWFSAILFLLMIPETTFLLITHAIVLFNPPDQKIRCAIPPFENTGWTFDEIQNISQSLPLQKNCSYYDYNYTVFNGLDFYEALNFVNHVPKPKLKKCSDVVTNSNENYFTIYKEFNIFCEEGMQHCIVITPFFGLLIGYAIIAPLADIYGRRPVLVFGLNSLVIIILILNFVTVLEPFVIGRLLSGLSFSTVKITSEAIIVELISPIHRPYVYYTLNACTSGLAYTLLPFLFQSVYNWRYIQWMCTTGILFFPLIKWYVPESPLWLFSIEKKGKAWATLKILKQPENLNESLLMHRNDDNTTINNYSRHYRKLIRFILNKEFLASIVLVSLTGAAYMKNYVEIYDASFMLNGRWKDLIIVRGLTDFGSLILSTSGTYFIGRKYFIVILQVCTILACGSLCFDLGSVPVIIIYFLLDVTTSSTFLVSKLHCIENIPSSHRCTILGIYGFASTFTTIIFLSLIFHINNTISFMIMGCSCIIGIVASLITLPDNEKVIPDVYKSVNNNINLN